MLADELSRLSDKTSVKKTVRKVGKKKPSQNLLLRRHIQKARENTLSTECEEFVKGW